MVRSVFLLLCELELRKDDEKILRKGKMSFSDIREFNGLCWVSDNGIKRRDLVESYIWKLLLKLWGLILFGF